MAHFNTRSRAVLEISSAAFEEIQDRMLTANMPQGIVGDAPGVRVDGLDLMGLMLVPEGSDFDVEIADKKFVERSKIDVVNHRVEVRPETTQEK